VRRPTLLLLAFLALSLPGALAAQDEEPRDQRPRSERDRDRDRDYDRDRDRDRRDCHCGLREVRDDHRGPYRRSGFWLSAGLGAGSESFDANDGLGWSDDDTGGIAFLKMGGTVSRSFLLGVEANVWGEQYRGAGYDRTLASLMVVGQWYPAPATGFWLRGGLGWARDEYDEYGPGGITLRENGSAFALGMGYDVPVGRSVSITPLLDFQAQHYDTHDERIVSFGVGITVH